LSSFSERFAAAGFAASSAYPCYGLAEATLFVTGVKPGSGLQLDSAHAHVANVVSCGATPPEHSVVIVDPATLERVAEGHTGEIWVSGPSVAQGYWQNADASAAAFVEHAGVRYLRTGDLGFERAGQLFISGRLKDLVIVRGRNLVPQDIEDDLAHNIPALQLGRIAVFPLHTDSGEAIAVAAELSRAAARSMRPELLCQSIALAVHACVDEPARLVILLGQGALPRTSSGKLQRNACAARLLSAELKTLAVFRDGKLERPQPSAAEVAELT
jgi:acyl-CoA synthetase (AMP-forming)/AMP-acid ligase II